MGSSQPALRPAPRVRAGAAAMALLVALAVGIVGCGPSGEGAETDPEKGSDVEILNEALGREMAGIELYAQAMPRLPGAEAAVGRRLRAHAQEYVSAITKAIRGAGGDTDAEALEVDLTDARSAEDLLLAAYQHESAALSDYVETAPRLYTAAPRTLASSLAAGHAQHLVVLRRALGASAAGSIPEAFDVGEVEPPGGRSLGAEG